MIPSPNHSSRLGERVRLVVIHTSEGARTVESLGAFLQRVTNASYHGAVDDHRYESYVNYSRAAWHLRNGNQEADGLCLCAFAGWSRAEWLRHLRMLELTAAWIADRCVARRVPIDHIPDRTVGDVMRDDRHRGGVTDHNGYTKGTGDGTHWDVGPSFPFDVVIPRARQIAGQLPQEDDMGAVQNKQIADIHGQVAAIHAQLLRTWNNPGPVEGPGHGTPVELIAQTHHMLTAGLDYTTWRDGDIGSEGNHYEHTMGARQGLVDVQQRLDTLEGKIDQLLGGGGIPNP